jgi:hypothetical protein
MGDFKQRGLGFDAQNNRNRRSMIELDADTETSNPSVVEITGFKVPQNGGFRGLQGLVYTQ